MLLFIVLKGSFHVSNFAINNLLKTSITFFSKYSGELWGIV
jgi:hypothetical protein